MLNLVDFLFPLYIVPIMSKSKKTSSAGLAMYRFTKGTPEVFLVHPGGPEWENDNRWGIPKGRIEPGENSFTAAKREFVEETGVILPVNADYCFLGKLMRSSGNPIWVWAFELNWNGKFVSNIMQVEHPRKSGKTITIPENDKGEYFNLKEARKIVFDSQQIVMDALDKFFADAKAGNKANYEEKASGSKIFEKKG